MIKRNVVRKLCQLVKSKLILGIVIVTSTGNLISLIFKTSGVTPSQPLIWRMGTIWFGLF